MTTKEGRLLANITDRIRKIPEYDLENLANTMQWGTFGKTGTESLKIMVLNDLDTDHLENILITQRQISVVTSRVILYILKNRYTQTPTTHH